ncbi:MAG: amino acid ABC transporter ATP-binding protein [Myxococcales bacterium]|nr:amino acid ABC transporter ATP-binding protein [Myxococcales bacterium]
MIEVEGLRKCYGTRTVIDGVSLSFDRGQVVSLIGPSGGGKSTLLRCLNGLESFDGGAISVMGQKLVPGGPKVNASALLAIRQKVGMVFQSWNLFAHRSAVGNIVEAPVHVKKVPIAEATERAHALLKRVGLGHRADAYPHEMSGGEQQRVAIARALAMDPQALLLDEPTSALDPERVGEVLDVLTGLAEGGLTMLIVTHEMRFARDVSHRVLVLHGGRVIEDGPPAQVLDQPTHERTRAFLGLSRPPKA